MLYGGAIAIARSAAWIAPASNDKLIRTFRARRGLMGRWRTLAAATRDPTRPLLWFHAPSVGEGLQARPVIQLLRQRRPDLQIAYSFFSPSAEAFARGLPVDMAEYLPFDSAHDMRELVRVLNPDALLFVKLDVWPHMIAAAGAAGVSTGLLSGTVAAGSGRLTQTSQTFLHDAYSALDVVGAIDRGDAARLQTLGVRPDVMQTTGDTRFDQVWQRRQKVNSESATIRALQSTRPTTVAGSTWPADETVLFGAWREVMHTLPAARLVIAPHEPTNHHLTRIMTEAKRLGLSLVRLSQLVNLHQTAPMHYSAQTPPDAEADILLIDSVGVLGDAYSVADVAYVGGGFHRAGLHSVLEPAAFGVPVLFGPGFEMSREAGILIKENGARSVSNSAELASALIGWLSNNEERHEWGARAEQVIVGGLGAADRSVGLVLDLLQHRQRAT